MTSAKKTPRKSKPKLHIVGDNTAKINAVKPTLQDGKVKLNNLPFTTKSGLKIGQYYVPRQPIQMSRDEEFWQSILLGIKPTSNIPMYIYIIGLLVLVRSLVGLK